jgi:hypothetical protein
MFVTVFTEAATAPHVCYRVHRSRLCTPLRYRVHRSRHCTPCSLKCSQKPPLHTMFVTVFTEAATAHHVCYHVHRSRHCTPCSLQCPQKPPLHPIALPCSQKPPLHPMFVKVFTKAATAHHVRHRVHRSRHCTPCSLQCPQEPPLHPILRHINPAYTLTLLFNIHLTSSFDLSLHVASGLVKSIFHTKIM